MNVIVSIVLCLAMLLGGGGSLPAEPASATTWAIRNVTLTLDGESVTLAPEARITAAAGSERAALHFEVESDGKTILPITLDAAPDALRFSLGNARAYNLSAAELEKLLTFANPEDAQTLEIAADYIQSYGAFIASMLHDPESVRQHEEAVQALLFERCATPEGETQVEIDGQTYPAQKLRLHSDFSMIDALRDCGWPELEAMLNGALNLLNRTAGLSANSFEEFYASAANNGGAQAMPAMPDLLLTVAETEDFTYYRYDGMDFESSANPAFALKTGRAESILRKDGATANVEMSLTANGTTMDISLDETLTGDPYDPDIIDVNCDIHITPGADSGASPMDFAVTFDAAKNAENKLDGALRVQCPAEINGAALPFDEFALSFAQGSESGATTIGLAATNAGETVAALDFDVLRTEAAPEDYFADAQTYEITSDALESSEANPLMMALMSDVSQLSLDGMQLTQEPSVQTMGEMIQRFVEESTVNASGSAIFAVEGAPVTVNSLEEAEAIYQGEIPAYTPPEGYELTQIEAMSSQVNLHYENQDGGPAFEIVFDPGYSMGAQSYICEDGTASPLTAPLAQIYPMDDGTTYSAYVTMPDNSQVTFDFEDAVTPDQLATFLGGLSK